MNKKRETIRKQPIDPEAVPIWDDQERTEPSTQPRRGRRLSDEEDMILEKDDD